MADEKTLLERLKAKHDRYEQERIWHKFLLDAYAGTGGFEGKVKMPAASFWGAGADQYAASESSLLDGGAGIEEQIDTYLDRYPREDLAKFKRRAAAANYTNPVETAVDIRLSYLNRKPMTFEGVDALTNGEDAWIRNADGRGTPWSVLFTELIEVRAEVIGWCPVLVDMPRADVQGELSVQRARELGLRPRVIPLFPANIWDWHCDDAGELLSAKIATHFTERADLLSEPVEVTEVAVWDRRSVRTWQIREVDGEEVATLVRELEHGWGRVPLVICRHKPAPTDTVRGISMAASIAKIAKRLLNYTSELDEVLRSCTFPMLQVPTDDPDKLGPIVIGAANALPVKTDSSTEYKWLQPDADVADVYERRIDASEKRISRIARTEYVSNAGSGESTGPAKSGESRAFEFENMNRALCDTAQQFARFIEELFRLVLRLDGASPDVERGVRVTPPDKFDVEEMARELEEALAATSLDLGPTAMAEMRKRLVRKLLPNLSEDLLAQIDKEIEERQVEHEQDRALQREQLASGGVDDAEDDDAPAQQKRAA